MSQVEEWTAKLAELAVFGANIQPGQLVSVTSYIGKEELTRAVTRAAYERGAKYVDVLYFDQWLKRDWRGNYRGQKQIWFLLRLTGRDCDVCLRACEKPEFDAWRWSEYWVPIESVIDFKRDVYQKALNELARYLRRRSDSHAMKRPVAHQVSELSRN